MKKQSDVVREMKERRALARALADASIPATYRPAFDRGVATLVDRILAVVLCVMLGLLIAGKR